MATRLEEAREWLTEAKERERAETSSRRSGRQCSRLEQPHLLEEFKDIQAHITRLLTKAGELYELELTKRKFGSWIDIMDEWGEHAPHNHHPNILSGVLYIHVPEGAADLRFRDPRPARAISEWDRSNCEIPVGAVTGGVIIFPSWLEHYVEARKENKGRIALSFNVGQKVVE
jgi:uncharacterized protein (TIGR02466 family)